MARAEATIEIAAPLAEVWAIYFDRARWASWVDGFAAVVSAAENYPETGSELVWRSGRAGRGEVRERVLAHEPRSLHRIAYTDPGSHGELETRLEMLPAEASERGRRTRVDQRLDYGLIGGGPFSPLTDLLFIRSQMRRSLTRSLTELKLEAERTGATSAGP